MPTRTRAPGKKRPTPTRRPWGPSSERACELTRKHSSAANAADERGRGGGLVSALAVGAAQGATEPPPDEARRPGRRRSTPYLLLLPGALGLGRFFGAPSVVIRRA